MDHKNLLHHLPTWILYSKQCFQPLRSWCRNGCSKSFVEKFKGDIDTESELGVGTTFRIKLLIKFSTTHVLIISVGNQKFGFPADNVILSKTIYPKDIFILEGQSTVVIEKQPVHLVQLANYLEIAQITAKKITAPTPCLFIQSDGIKLALVVDSVIEKMKSLLNHSKVS